MEREVTDVCFRGRADVANVDRHFRSLSRNGHFPLAKRKYPVLRARDLNLTSKYLSRIGAHERRHVAIGRLDILFANSQFRNIFEWEDPDCTIRRTD